MRKQWKSLTGLYRACKCVGLIWRRHLFLSDCSFTEPQLSPCCPAFLFTHFPLACPPDPTVIVSTDFRLHCYAESRWCCSCHFHLLWSARQNAVPWHWDSLWAEGETGSFWSKASEFTTCPTVHLRLLLQRIHTLLIFLWGCIKLLRAEAWQGEALIKKTASPFLFVLHFNFCIITALIANTDRNRQVKALS